MEEFQPQMDIFKGVYGDLEEFADRVSSVIGCPITIEDANHRLLAYSMHNDKTDTARTSTIISRRVPEKIINSLWKEGIIPALLQHSDAILVPSISEVGLGKRAAVSIRKNKEVLGFIWALETDSPMDQNSLNFLQLAAKEAKNQLLQLQTKKKRREESYQEFFWKLLTGHFPTEKDIREQFSDLPFVMPSTFSIIVFAFPSEINADLEKQIIYLITTTQKVKINLYTIDGKRLILLCDSDVTSSSVTNNRVLSFIDSFISDMNTRFTVSHVTAGCSSFDTLYENAQNNFQEALTVIEMKQTFPSQLQTVFLYDELGIYQYIKPLAAERLADALLHHGIRSLVTYDKQHGTNLYSTLEVFLESDSNPNLVAKTLHIHLNTLAYRLKRIAEISGFDLKNPALKSYLFIELKLAIYLKFLHKT